MKCRNDKCEFYSPLCRSGCDEYNMRVVKKCENFKSISDYEQEQVDNWSDLNCDASGNTISDADEGL